MPSPLATAEIKPARAIRLRRVFAAISCERSTRTHNITVYYPNNTEQWDACHYMLKEDGALAVTRSMSGAIAAYRRGRYLGFFPSVDLAVAAVRDNLR